MAVQPALGLRADPVAVAVLIGLLALSYIGYIGPWQQDGPPFVAGTADDAPEVAE